MNWPNKITGANSRPASPLDAGRQFACASCAPPPLSAAVAQFWRSDTPVIASFYPLSGCGLSYFSSMFHRAVRESRFSGWVDSSSGDIDIADPVGLDSPAAEPGRIRTRRFSELAGAPQLAGPLRFGTVVFSAASH